MKRASRRDVADAMSPDDGRPLQAGNEYMASWRILRAEVIALRRDKARMDWLAKNKWHFYSADAFQLNHGAHSFARKTPRRAIDAAMKAARQSKEG